METIAAVVVTYNRLSLLKECLSALKSQTRKLDSIIVINNSSTDGTTEWLNSQNDLHVVHQENGGGALGFYRGMKEAYKLGFDWIWLMDDDVEPLPNCLEEMLISNELYNNQFSVLQPDRKYLDVATEWQYGSRFNFSNPFKPEAIDPIRSSDFKGEKIKPIVSFPFEGPMFKRQVIEKVGFADKRYFIMYDDTDYSARVHRAGFKVGFARDAVMKKKIRNQSVGINMDWKMYYIIRNQIIIDRKFGNPFITVSRALYNNLYRVMAVGKLSVRKKSFADFPKNVSSIAKAVVDGFKFRLAEQE
ncbi:glycosyltransferase family 2 protein [Pedobacter sp. SYSU D00535]|uniref:glycosyltransferase family 2 protein n=1 Tax=Pedobacter sp. SYSU D00535 TaxID=2810308 RepID=UPI001A978616|nr:glycosyltransferase family 2 protein [Pedobacter sp. SYSU D00535]